MIAIILDNTCNSFLEINLSDFIIRRNNKQVINKTKNKEIIWKYFDVFIKLAEKDQEMR